MSETNFLLRTLTLATKEFKTSALTVTWEATEFSTQLTEGYFRKGFYTFNNSNAASGECYWGGSDVTTGTGQVIPKGAAVEIPIADTLPVYFVCDSGELGNLRILEIS